MVFNYTLYLLLCAILLSINVLSKFRYAIYPKFTLYSSFVLMSPSRVFTTQECAVVHKLKQPVFRYRLNGHLAIKTFLHF